MSRVSSRGSYRAGSRRRPRRELDAGDLVAVELPLEGDFVDVVVLDRRENATKMVPADLARGEHRFELVLVTRLVSPRRGEDLLLCRRKTV